MSSKVKELTYGLEILSNEVGPHMTSTERQVRKITVKKPRGRRNYYLTIQETLNGEYCSHSLV